MRFREYGHCCVQKTRQVKSQAGRNKIHHLRDEGVRLRGLGLCFYRAHFVRVVDVPGAEPTQTRPPLRRSRCKHFLLTLVVAERWFDLGEERTNVVVKRRLRLLKVLQLGETAADLRR